mmetsp:Transcript_28698/g.60344  ORF Transcript_28698/g.60344 Transcript_28698/m.60344 type:complete len:716 (+) Transcript_28698:93-2240(+)
MADPADDETSGEMADTKNDAQASETMNLTGGEDAGDFDGVDVDDTKKRHFGELKERYFQWKSQPFKLPRYYKLQTDDNARKYSIWAVNFFIACSAVNTKMLNPNFAIMCQPGASGDSFESTEPFGFNSATYFLPMTTLLGVAMSSVFIGSISDRIGRKIVMLVLAWISAVGSIVKFFTKETFWGFSASNFAFGFFLGNLPVGMAYVGDIETDKMEKDNMLGVLVGCFVLGNSGGGIIAVLMNDAGLFAPLWVGAGLMAMSAIVGHIYMIEPGDSRLGNIHDSKITIDLFAEEEKVNRPLTIDKKTLWNIVGGALLDNIGSTGLFPLCLSPLAMEQFYTQFVEVGKEPIMTIDAYQWLSVCVALLVIPSTQMTPYVFTKIGVAGTCVFGNLFTALVTGVLLAIGNMAATDLAFGFFVFVMYAGFPFTVFSQLTTGPMLDVIAPEDKIGFVQGLNNSSMSFGMAIAPWAFGILADYTSSNISIITGIAFSILAAVINAILVWHPLMGRPKPKVPAPKKRFAHEDEELVNKILDGEFVDPELVFDINRDRGIHGKPALIPRVRPYSEEKDHLESLAEQVCAAAKFREDMYDRILNGIASNKSDPNNFDFSVEEVCEIMNSVRGNEEELMAQSFADLGAWMGEYLADNGYDPHTSSVLLKQMFMIAFPSISRELEFTPNNIEERLVKAKRVMAKYVRETGEEPFTVTSVLGSGPAIFYS